MVTVTKNPTRERILDAAEKCFYQNGITSTGVDTLAEAAGVSKRTLYNHFSGKEEVVVAYLERRERQWRDRLALALEGEDDPVEQVAAYVHAYCETDELEGHRGCAFINASAELADDSHPGVAIIKRSIADVERGVGEILESAGLANADELARQLLLVLEGAMSVSGIRRNGDAFTTAEQFIRSLVRGYVERP